jgi:hypothetical protein
VIVDYTIKVEARAVPERIFHEFSIIKRGKLYIYDPRLLVTLSKFGMQPTQYVIKNSKLFIIGIQ